MRDSRAQRDRKWRERQEVERLGQWRWKWPAGANVTEHPFASWTPMQGDEEIFQFLPQKNQAWRSLKLSWDSASRLQGLVKFSTFSLCKWKLGLHHGAPILHTSSLQLFCDSGGFMHEDVRVRDF